MRTWSTKAELDELWKKLILMIYFEFCHNQRDQRMWEAGFETYNKIGV